MNSIAVFTISPLQNVFSLPLVPRSTHVSRVSRWTVSSPLTGPATGFSLAKVHKQKFSSYRLAHVFRDLQQTFWQFTRSWQILFGMNDNELLRRSPWHFDARWRLAAPRIENIEFQRTGNEPCRSLFYYSMLPSIRTLQFKIAITFLC